MIAGLLLGMPGCTGHLDGYRHDHSTLRRQQAEQVARLVPDPAERQRWKKTTGRRVFRLLPADGNGAARQPKIPGGRAVAVSEDGYFLTADHVLSGDTRLLVQTMVGKPPEKPFPSEQMERYLKRQMLPVRVVWRDRRLDLALVKVERRNAEFFDTIASEVVVGEVVHTADDEGDLLIAGKGDLIGNGPFEAAGKVVSVKNRDGTRWITTDLLARGGMSGAPLVTGKGELAGILLRVRANPFTGGNFRSEAVMIPWPRIAEMMERDRRRGG